MIEHQRMTAQRNACKSGQDSSRYLVFIGVMFLTAQASLLDSRGESHTDVPTLGCYQGHIPHASCFCLREQSTDSLGLTACVSTFLPAARLKLLKDTLAQQDEGGEQQQAHLAVSKAKVAAGPRRGMCFAKHDPLAAVPCRRIRNELPQQSVRQFLWQHILHHLTGHLPLQLLMADWQLLAAFAPA